jgi:chemotaxis protein CheD
MKKIIVGIADLAATHNPHTLVTLGLGSCVGIALHDKKNHIGGLLHIMLPCSKYSKNTKNPAKFADTGIPLLIEKMEKLGADRKNITAKIAGGAHMFSFGKKAMHIGEDNIKAVKDVLRNHNIRIISEDCGGNWGRTLEFNTVTGEVKIKSSKKGIKII